MRPRSSAIITGLALCSLLGRAHAEDEPRDAAPFPKLTPPALLRQVAQPARHIDLPQRRDTHLTSGALSLDLGLAYLHLAVHGDHRPGFSTFLGTSTASLGGLRLRF